MRSLGRTLLALLAAVALAGWGAPPRRLHAHAPDASAVVRAYLAAWNAHDLDVAMTHVAPGAVIRYRGAGISEARWAATRLGPAEEGGHGEDTSGVDRVAGTEAIRTHLWAEFAWNTHVETANLRTTADGVTWTYRLHQDPERHLPGVGPIEGRAEAVVRAGRITHLSFAPDPASVARRNAAVAAVARRRVIAPDPPASGARRPRPGWGRAGGLGRRPTGARGRVGAAARRPRRRGRPAGAAAPPAPARLTEGPMRRRPVGRVLAPAGALWLAFARPLHAQEAGLLSVAQAYAAAWNAHDLAAVLALFAPDAVVRERRGAVPAAVWDTRDPQVVRAYLEGAHAGHGEERYDIGGLAWALGHRQLAAWAAARFAQHHRFAAGPYRAAGDAVGWPYREFVDPYQRAPGVGPAEGDAEAVVRGGRITRLTLVQSPASVQRVAPGFTPGLLLTFRVLSCAPCPRPRVGLGATARRRRGTVAAQVRRTASAPPARVVSSRTARRRGPLRSGVPRAPLPQDGLRWAYGEWLIATAGEVR